MLHAVNDLADSVHVILRASAELSREQAALDQDRERDPAPRDFAVGKVVEAFNRFAAGAQAAKEAACDQDHSPRRVEADVLIP
jgi:hypothetical protein